MGFLGIGAMEALVILVIALIIFGPGRLPEIMGEAGRAVRDFRRATRELTGDFEESIREVRDTYEELERDMRETAREIKRETKGITDEVNKAVSKATKVDSKPQTTKPKRAASKPLDQDDFAFDPDEDLSQYFPATRKDAKPETTANEGAAVDGAGTESAEAEAPQTATAAARPAQKKSPARKKAPAKPEAVPAASSNGATKSVDDLLATEEGDDLLSIDD